MDIAGYVSEIRALHAIGQRTEHSFRPALARLFQSIDPTLTVINEPKRLVDVGAPDFVFACNGISIGWCEAKDIGKDVTRFAANDYSKEQKGRYTKGLPNLIYTNGLDFEFIRQGAVYSCVTIVDLIPTLRDRPENFAELERLLRDFAAQTPVSITSAKQLAEMMAGKAAYNPAKRKARGAWYTPEPVVNFIVRAVDYVLKAEFGLPDGLADTSKVTVDWDTGQSDTKGKPIIVKKDVHRVQVLDPATGTGTFLAEVVKQLASRMKGIAPGQWSGYVEKDLIPRLHGVELLTASYAMCHKELDMMLTELGYQPSGNPPRLSVCLTNSLEEGERVEQTLPFARWISEEAKGANTIKRDEPIMCVIGNPPYSGECV